MTEELAAELLELLQSPNIQVKHGTFSAILQYTQSESNKKLLIGSSLFRLLLKNLFVPQLTTICLSTMISFSSSKMFQN